MRAEANVKLTHTRLLVTHFVECVRFYRDVVNLEINWGTEDGNYVSYNTGNTILALFKRHLMAQAVGASDKPAHADCQDRVALIFEVDSVDETYRQLKAKGVQFVTEPTDRPDWGIRAAHFRDPDGNLIEVYTDL
jgi:catechol 2,3-dioxygenase-like lactoylglutathione lyase family enzyme